MTRPSKELLDRLEQAVLDRDGHREGKEIRFACPLDGHDDQHPTARYNPDKGVWNCPKCGVGHGALDLAKRLNVALPERDEVTKYPIYDANGSLVATKCRTGSGSGKKCWWSPKGVKTRELPLFGLPGLVKANAAEIVVLCEGEKAADALMQIGVVAVGTVTGAASIPNDDALVPMVGRKVALWPDNDTEGRNHMDRIAAALLRLGAADLQRVDWTAAREKGDAHDWIAAGGTKEELAGMLKPYVAPTQTVEEPEVSTVKAEGGQGIRLKLRDTEPWPMEVEGAKLLGEIAAYYSDYLVLPKHADTVLALWTVHTFAASVAWATPYIAVSSPTMRCGKTTLLDLASYVCHRPLKSSAISPAAFFRAVAKYRPTLLVDEADNVFRGEGGDDIRAITNAGYSRQSSCVVRCVGKTHEPKQFDVFGPKLIALIGSLPPTLVDRSIPIRMRRKRNDEKRKRARGRKLVPVANELARKAARWCADHLDMLGDTVPDFPRELSDRAADIWEPLLALAAAAGAEWPKRARNAAIDLCGGEANNDETAIDLLADIRDAFGDRDRLPTKCLLAMLKESEDRPWADWNKGNGLTAYGLAKLLRPFGIFPKTIKMRGKTPKGYMREQFAEAWRNYFAAPETGTEPQPRNRPQSERDPAGLERATGGPRLRSENRGKVDDHAAGCEVADCDGEEEDELRRLADDRDGLLDDDAWSEPPPDSAAGSLAE